MAEKRYYDYVFTYFLPNDEKVFNIPIDEESKINMINKKLCDFFNNDKLFKYVIFQLEKCPDTARLHFQGYFYFNNARSFNATKTLLTDNGFNAMHIEVRSNKSTIQESSDYCQKEDSRYITDFLPNGLLNVFGGLPSLDEINQGKRTDLEAFIKRINDGLTYNELLLEFPTYSIKYEKFYYKMRKQYLEKLYMTSKRKMNNELYLEYTYSDDILDYVYATYGYDNVYRLPSYNKYAFDDYNEQKIIVLDNYDEQFKDNFLLKLLSGNPLYLGARYENKVACFDKVIVITRLSEGSFQFDNHIFGLKNYFNKIEVCPF